MKTTAAHLENALARIDAAKANADAIDAELDSYYNRNPRPRFKAREEEELAKIDEINDRYTAAKNAHRVEQLVYVSLASAYTDSLAAEILRFMSENVEKFDGVPMRYKRPADAIKAHAAEIGAVVYIDSNRGWLEIKPASGFNSLLARERTVHVHDWNGWQDKKFSADEITKERERLEARAHMSEDEIRAAVLSMLEDVAALERKKKELKEELSAAYKKHYAMFGHCHVRELEDLY